jgi:hypothetical protein
MFCVSQQKAIDSLHFATNASGAAAMPEVLLIDAQHPQRENVEELVKTIFKQSFGANLTSFYPYFLAINDEYGKCQATVGLRPGSSALFCEHYLPYKAEEMLGSSREYLVEIGNLATSGAGRIRWIIAALTAFLEGVGFSNVLFTITPLLRNSFVRMGLPLTYLASAKAECLPEGMEEDWGAYYECHPEVYAGDISAGFNALSIKVQTNETLESIWSNAYAAGKRSASLMEGRHP